MSAVLARLAERDAAARELRAGYDAIEHGGSRADINDGLRRLLYPEPTWWQRVVTRLRRAPQGPVAAGQEILPSPGRDHLGAGPHFSTGGAR